MQHTEQVSNNGLQWFPMRVRYSSGARLMALRDALTAQDVECHVPLVFKKVGDRMQFAPAINNLIFLHATRETVSSLKQTADFSCLSYMMRRELDADGAELTEVLTVPRQQMDDFIRVTTERSEDIVYLDNLDFACRPSAMVQITEGPFAGVVGRLKSLRKHLCVVLPIDGVAAVAITHIPRKHLIYLDTDKQ